jgi:ATP-dependent DNA helicase RecQ
MDGGLMRLMAMSLGPGARRQALLGYFGERDHPPCGNCDTCLEPQSVWDGLVAAQKALSAVFRTGQRFGVQHLVDVLLGKLSDRVARLGHDRIKTFGVGADLDKRDWQSVFRQLVAQGHLAVDTEGHGGLYLGESAPAVLRGEVGVAFRKEPAAPERGRRRASSSTATGSLAPGEEGLWQRLRARRLELAREQGVPPYVIFHDATLIEMARRRPQSLAALAQIPGVGRSKLERYGEVFMAILTEEG